MSDPSASVTEVLERARQAAAEKGETVSVGDVFEKLGARAHGPALLLLGVISLTPVIGGLPGVGFLVMTLMLMVSTHLLVSGGGFYLPRVLARRELDAEALEEGLRRVRPWGERLERVCRPRLSVLLRPAAVRLAAATCIALALTMLPLGLVPFAVAPPSFVIALFGLALVSRDGAVMAAAFALSAAALAFALWVWP
ncbi:MAG: exopolysaccharide biosynthesis protein [Paracoccaceae bacterium]